MELLENKKYDRIRVCPEFMQMIEAVRKHMEKYSYGILEVSYVDATKLLFKKMEKFGGIEKFLEKYRLEV